MSIVIRLLCSYMKYIMSKFEKLNATEMDLKFKWKLT